MLIQKNNPIKYCIDCNDELVPNINWYPSSQRQHMYICNDCQNKRNRDWDIVNPGKVKKSRDDWIEKNPEKNKESKTKYNRSPKGRANSRKEKAKRRGLGNTPLFDNPFDESVEIRWHHPSDEFVVAIPRDLHELYTGFKEHKELCMNIINQIYIERGNK